METRTQIQNIVTINDLQYGNLLMDAAYSYLSAALYGSKDCIRMITLSKYFWEWWENQWEKRNRQYLNNIETLHEMGIKRTIKEKYEMYLTYHDITHEDLRIHPVVMDLIQKDNKLTQADKTYEDMMAYVIGREVNPLKL